MLVAFDESLFSGFRHTLYPTYKANRALPDPDLAYQLMLCRELAEALGLCCRSSEVFEADDVLYSGAVVARGMGAWVEVVTRDKDLAQIVGAGDHWSDWHSGDRLDWQQLTLRWGVAPAQIPEVLALAGDAVDNIPGIPRIGLKTAVTLIGHFGDLESLFCRIDEVATLPVRGGTKLGEHLMNYSEQALLFRELIRLHQADCEIAAEDLVWTLPRARLINDLLEFRRLGPGFQQAWERFAS